ncbi:protein SON-like [Amphibalanus amphitrite]|uniref:protein SON-like n=1 Tax=Amphibalanus amphitrite TaxID=1232801 RepID=UPI001C9026B4|nr:protein SON-like [Amphibalanus amphitrite]XP_043240746.1 protein SON-like [Amphibalanus amphitrite]XP_043240747.1 protein SON-like [Amphibalanus amphitrite]
MDDPDLYDDILGGTLSTERPRCVEVLLEVGVHRRVLRLPENTSSPLSAVRTAAARLLGSDAGLRDSLGSEHLVFQRRSLKFDTWVDMVAVGERPVADGERLRALTKKVLEAGEVMSSDGETVRDASDADRGRSGDRKRRHKKRRHGSRSRRRRRRRHHRSSSSDSRSPSGDSGREGRRSSGSSRRRERRRHSGRHRHRRSRSVSSESGSDRSRSSRRSSSVSSRGKSSSRRNSSTSKRRGPPSPPVSSVKPRVPPPLKVSEQAWQHMDPEFAKQLREYELDQARRQDNEELRRHLSELVEISDGDLSVSDDEPPPASGASVVVSELGQRVLDRLKKLREEFGGGDQAQSSADKESDEAPEEKPEPTLSKGGPLYASFLNLESKHPPMALNEYCTAREWEAPVFHLTEKPSNSKKQKMFTAAVRVNKRMYTVPFPVVSKKEGKRHAAQYCLQKLGVLKGGEVYKRMEGEQDVI